MNFKEFARDIYYVGVNDRMTSLFEGLWPLPMGVTYNSYIVKGSDKLALIDGVAIGECEKFRQNIVSRIGDKAPDYIIINHMEPDHSGALAAIRSFFPDITIVGNAKTLEMVKGFYGITDNVMKVADGDSIDLGGVSLVFRLTPMVHWPETMMTYVPERNVLFSGDAFGCFGALAGGVVDSEMDIEPYMPEMYRYYSNIVGKYGVFVQKALSKLSSLKLDYICPTHGPVWHDEIARVVDIYDRLSRYEGEEGVTIVYGSMYGNTEEMAEAIASRLAENGVKKIRMHDASRSHLSYILADIFRYRGLVIGGPTYSNTLYPPVEAVVRAITTREMKNRVISVFGSYTWAPQAVKRIESLLGENRGTAGEVVSVEARQSPDSDAIDGCRALADQITSRLQESV
ncbi:FprA family A-type flavoprotein [uncultured Muribaculum sp.]|uniref:FprA family A-type flavoprotein n=1 Tax=uncultured Muribaculum sp. TaxID=1918613 RepID=UPI0025EF5F4F|nr:FprA family A-type flavoprotein [uncultured Muribaculum sp.]